MIMKTEFINYANRGASEYCPENTLLSFYTGLYMGANGIETDVQRTKDGVSVLFHDDTLTRVTGEAGAIADYTLEELLSFRVKKDAFEDKIVTLEEFLEKFSIHPVTFAIELKVPGVESDTAWLLRKYNLEGRAVVTSFNYQLLANFRAIAPEFDVGYLVPEANEKALYALASIGGEEICPRADTLTPELVSSLHSRGLRVRAWGVKNEELMHHALACGADGMTVNFPDKLTEALKG